MALQQNDGKININVSKPYSGELTPQDFKAPSIQAPEMEKISVTNKAINAALFQATGQAIQQGIDAHAQLSGNFVVSDTIGNLTNLSTSALAMLSGGPLGVIMVGANYALKSYQAYTDAIVQNRQISYDKTKLGQISREGSRYW